MEKREKIKKIYQKYDVCIKEDYLEEIMQDKKRVNDFMRLYKEEELKSMNFILGKEENNRAFTKFESEALGQIDLFDSKVVNICKVIWDNRDNEEKLNSFMKQLII